MPGLEWNTNDIAAKAIANLKEKIAKYGPDVTLEEIDNLEKAEKAEKERLLGELDKAKQQASRTKAPWITLDLTMVRVLIEMPEADALWLRQHLHENRIEGNGSKIQALEFDKDHKALEMHIREILLNG